MADTHSNDSNGIDDGHGNKGVMLLSGYGVDICMYVYLGLHMEVGPS